MSAFCDYKKSPNLLNIPDVSGRDDFLGRGLGFYVEWHKSLLPWAWAAAEERQGIFSKVSRSCKISPGQTVLEARSRHCAPNYSVIGKM